MFDLNESAEIKPKRRWQNLLHNKCPNCNTRLEDARLYLKCPNLNETDKNRNCFFIKKDKAFKYLLDPEHPANKCLSSHERENLTVLLASVGIIEVK